MGDRTHYLDRKPGKFGVTIQENPNKGKHGIGAILEKNIGELLQTAEIILKLILLYKLLQLKFVMIFLALSLLRFMGPMKLTEKRVLNFFWMVLVYVLQRQNRPQEPYGFISVIQNTFQNYFWHYNF
jgi:hypothetical protein